MLGFEAEAEVEIEVEAEVEVEASGGSLILGRSWLFGHGPSTGFEVELRQRLRRERALYRVELLSCS